MHFSRNLSAEQSSHGMCEPRVVPTSRGSDNISTQGANTYPRSTQCFLPNDPMPRIQQRVNHMSGSGAFLTTFPVVCYPSLSV